MAKILFLILDLDKPSTKKRILCSLDHLRSRGHEARVITVLPSVFARMALTKALRPFDLVVIQKKLFSSLQFLILKTANTHLVFDFDDAVMFHEVERNEPLKGKFFKRFLNTASGCKGVIAGNAYLAEFARSARIKPGKNDDKVVVLPTPVDTEQLTCKDCSGINRNVIIGWLGTKGNQVNLNHVHSALRNVLDSCPEAHFRLISNARPDPPGFPLQFKTWNQNDETEDLKEFDIGIMPLIDNMWTRGKGGYKLLQYMAVGAASVASPVGINTEIIDHGQNGFLARDEKEWTDILVALIRDPVLRQRIGRAARETVERSFSLQDYNRRLADFLESLL